jgi:phospholipase C
MLAALKIGGLADEARGADAEDIDTIEVIYAENRYFDSLYRFSGRQWAFADKRRRIHAARS